VNLIPAAAALAARRPGARFTILGSDWDHPALIAYRGRLEALVSELGLSGRLRLAGARSDVLEWLRGLDVFVHPPTEPDPFPAVVLEAAAAGCPIVATRTGGIPEAVAHERSALLVPPGDADALAEAVRRLLDDGDLANRLRGEARTAVARFTMAATAEGVAAAYAAVLAARSAGRLPAGP
jgi:glycosyltransferase involved in cell wall biosynthesis